MYLNILTGDTNTSDNIMKNLSKPNENDTDDRQMRGRAESRVAESDTISDYLAGKTQEEIIHELRVHQIELELQNEELKKAHLDLELSRDRYIDLYDFSPIGYITLTIEALISEVNLTGATMLGEVRHQLIHARFRRFISPNDYERWDQFFLTVLKHEESLTCRFQMVRKDGNEFSAQILGLCVAHNDGSFRVRIVMSDDTPRKQAEDALRQSEEQFRIIAMNTPNYICIQDQNLIYEWVINPGLGLSSEEMIGKTDFDIIDREQAEILTGLKQKVMRTGQPMHFSEVLFKDSSGTEFIYEGTYTPKRDHNGNVTGIIGYFWDITDRKHAAQKISEINEIFIRAQAIAHVGSWQYDLKKNVTEWSDEMYRIFGYEPRQFDVILENIRERIHPDYLSLHDKILSQAIATGHYEPEKYVIVHPDGSQRYVDTNGTVFRDDAGVVTQVVGVVHDITDSKHREDEIKILYADLEKKVEERTLELSEINSMLEEEVMHRTTAEKANIEMLSLLNATIESTEDGILVINNAGSITKWNNQFIAMWDIPESVIQTNDKTKTLISMINNAKNYEPFIHQILEGNDNSDTQDLVTVELNNGRIIECYSHPQRIKNDIIGRVWSFRDVTSRKKMEQQIKKSLKEKELLIKEIHHRVKNNMQVVSSLLFMQARKTKDIQVQEILHESQNRIKSIALVHERIYQSKDLDQIDYTDYIRKITRYLFESYQVDPNSISLSVSSEVISLPIDKAVPCSLIINELVSNAVKYAFPEKRKGTIQIGIKRHADTYVIEFRDDGVGMPEEIDFLHTKTLGLELTRGLVGQLNGTIELDRTAGTAYIITFPV